ncbi:MAG TPA: DUF6338 family protein [Pirellulales bacterium]|nr:DUF6338 family protein [Pirellulales bacterium]
MEVTDFTIRLLLLFFPGIICFLTVDALTVHLKRRPHEIALLAFVYAVFSYVIFALLKAPFGIEFPETGGIFMPPPQLNLFKALGDKAVPINAVEVAVVTSIAFLLGIATSYCINQFWFHDIARALKITKKFGPPNVWSFAFNINEVKWATVRDLEAKLMFQGYIRAFSDVEDQAEVLLTQVCVYNEATGKLLYEADHMYLARPKDNMTVEFPLTKQELSEG